MHSNLYDWLISAAGLPRLWIFISGYGDLVPINLIFDIGASLSLFVSSLFLAGIVIRRRDLLILWPVGLIAGFIALYGATHVIDMVTDDEPLSRPHSAMQAVIAIASVTAASALWPMRRRLVIAFDLHQMSVANLALQHQLTMADDAAKDLVQTNGVLERRVAYRIADLTRINGALETEIEINGRITAELLLTRDEAQKANGIKSLFLAAMSHDLRTPLNAIIGFSDMMLSESFGPIDQPRYRGYLEDIHVSGHLLLSLINNILDLSKIEAGKRDFEPHHLDGGCLVNACLRLLQGKIDEKRILITVAIDPQSDIYADDLSFRQVMLNLLSNAVNFTPADGKITVRVLPSPGGGVSIEISDDGPGMSDASLQEALEPFGKHSAMTARPPGAGSGLGISIVVRLMELHGGSLSFQSLLGHGTTARVAFPSQNAGTPLGSAIA